MSISRSQAELLASGFLDSIGSGDSLTLQPRETFAEIILLAGELIEMAQDNLNKSNSNATGRLSASLAASEPVKNGNIFKVDIFMNEYGRYVNKGVKGTKGGQGQYSFKNEFPSRKMVAALMEGIRRARKKVFNTSRRTVSRNEQKNRSISEISKAYGAGRNIKRYGIKKTGFLDKAIKATENKIDDRLGAALKVDIINSL